MKQIQLSNSTAIALVDDEDYHYVMSHNTVWTHMASGAAARSKLKFSKTEPGKGRKMSMHRLVLRMFDSADGWDVDHINRNNLDNRKENLRVCEHYKNLHNVEKSKRDLTSKYKGVSWHKKGRKWQVHLSVGGRRIYGGLFENENDAALMANEMMSKYVGEFAYLNTIS